METQTEEIKNNALLISKVPELLKIVLDFQDAFAGKVSMKPEPEYLDWFVNVVKQMNDLMKELQPVIEIGQRSPYYSCFPSCC